MFKARGMEDAPVIIVGDAPSYTEVVEKQCFYGGLGDAVLAIAKEAGFKPYDIAMVNCVSIMKKRDNPLTPDIIRNDASKYLIPFLKKHPRQMVIALGNNAVYALGLTEKPEGVNALRGKVLKSELINCPAMASGNPFFIMKTPDDVLEFNADFGMAYKIYTGNYLEQAPIHINDITKLSHIQDMYDSTVGGYEFLSYDFETTDKDRDSAQVVTCSFANGEVLPTGENVAWYWAGYDQLKPLYEQATLDSFKDAFDNLWQQAGKDYALISFNGNYDDWVAERYVGHELPGSQFDVMLMKWIVNNKRPHGLKDCTAMYLGYPDYEAGAHGYIKDIADRRKRILTDPIDTWILERYGIEPELSKTGKPKWPTGIDKKLCAYALLPADIIRLYNAYDAVYTRLLFDLYRDVIERDDLAESADLRHRISRELMRCEQRGFLMDQDTNWIFSHQLENIERDCEVKIQQEALKINPKLEDFNPKSSDQLALLLFGEPLALPVIDRQVLYREYNPQSVDEKVTDIEMSYYGDFEWIREAAKLGEIDFVGIGTGLIKAFRSKYPRIAASIRSKNFYLEGIYAPDDEKGYTKTGKPSVAGALLQTMYEVNPEPLLSLILMQRKANKLRSTFVDSIYDKLDKNGVLHGRLNVIGTETGRISSSDPNCQNFPKMMRGQLVPRPGYVFVEADLSAAEVRAIAAMSGDELLIEALNAKDIHTYIASKIFKKPESEINKDTERQYAKTILFGIIYGMTAYRLSSAIKVSVDEAEMFIQEFFMTFPKLKQWLDNQVALASTEPYYVYTPWGTRRSTRNMLSVDRGTKSHTERISMNMPIQGAAGELTLYYICEIMDKVREYGWDVHLVNTTHDSMTYEVPEDMAWFVQGDWIEKEEKYAKITAGPMVDLIKEVVSRPAPVAPLDTINFKIDVEINNYWSKQPDILKAIDPNYGTDKSKVRWDLIKPDEVLDKDDLEELIDAEEAYEARKQGITQL